MSSGMIDLSCVNPWGQGTVLDYVVVSIAASFLEGAKVRHDGAFLTSMTSNLARMKPSQKVA